MKTIQGTGKDNAEFNDKFGEWPVLNNPLVDNEEGVSPTDPNQSQSQSPPSKKKGSIKAEFIRKGGEFYVQVTGNGSGQIEFLMDINDDAFYASVAASKIEVPSDKGIIAFERIDQLERYRGKNEQPVTLFGNVAYKEREKIRERREKKGEGDNFCNNNILVLQWRRDQHPCSTTAAGGQWLREVVKGDKKEMKKKEKKSN